MGGRMQTLKESQRSVEIHRQDTEDARKSKRVRERSQFRVNDFVMHERRQATVRGVLGGEEYVIRYTDDESRVQVPGAELVRRYTSQTQGFVPKGAERAEIKEQG